MDAKVGQRNELNSYEIYQAKDGGLHISSCSYSNYLEHEDIRKIEENVSILMDDVRWRIIRELKTREELMVALNEGKISTMPKEHSKFILDYTIDLVGLKTNTSKMNPREYLDNIFLASAIISELKAILSDRLETGLYNPQLVGLIIRKGQMLIMEMIVDYKYIVQSDRLYSSSMHCLCQVSNKEGIIE